MSTFASGGRLAFVALLSIGAAVVAFKQVRPAAPLARAGNLDPNFGAGGRVLGPEGQSFSLVALPGGKILGGGCALRCSVPALVKYSSNGAIDTTFGAGGRIVLDAGSPPETIKFPNRISALAVQHFGGNDWRVLAVGGYLHGPPGRFMVLRFLPSGALDPDFGSGGIAVGPEGSAAALAVQPGGAIVVSGQSRGDAAVVRFLKKGTLDSSFGTGGLATADLGGEADVASAVVLSDSGRRIVAAANRVQTLNQQSTGSALLALLPTGQPDPGFGKAGEGPAVGRVKSPLDNISSLIRRPDGRFVAAGRKGDRLAMARFQSDGSPDPGFGRGGIARGPHGRAAALVATGTRLIAAGRTVPADSISLAADSGDAALAVFDPHGNIEGRFGAKGSVATDFGDRVDFASAVVVSGRRVLTAGGSGRHGSQNALAAYRLSPLRSAADLSVRSLQRPQTARQGGLISHRIKVKNLSSGDALGVRVTYRLPSGAAFSSAGSSQGVCSRRRTGAFCDLGGIRRGRSASLAIDIQALEPGIQKVSVSVSSASSDPDGSSNRLNLSTRVTAFRAWSPAKAMPRAIAEVTTTVLTSVACRDSQPPSWCGRVLVLGSNGTEFLGQLFDPQANAWTETSVPPGGDRSQHTATLLSDGRVLVAGGVNYPDYFGRADIYDPGSNAWTPAGALKTPRSGHASVALKDGRVLVAGGRNSASKAPPECGIGAQEMALSSVEIFDPVSSRWAAGPDMLYGRRFGLGTFTASLLRDGRALVVGGYRGDAFDTSLKRSAPCDGSDFAPAEIFDPSANGGKGVWLRTGNTAIGRSGHSATLMKNGKVLIAGGDTSVLSPAGNNSAEVFDPAAVTPDGVKGAWAPAGPLLRTRSRHTATALPDGRVLVVGGWGRQSGGQASPRGDAEIYNSASDRWLSAGLLLQARESHAAAWLGAGEFGDCGQVCGRVLVAGGNGMATSVNVAGVPLTSAELFRGVGK